ncbi:hypothetical protein [Bifidobacterium sp.]|jgi:hypothetical protein|uniref:hypothetical protein n=1 Tax=Bifidobacterium sp. TaxID=41200 RepID=UPI0025BB8BB1|nr:hypothetical protein [Bifidobacterium sp.]MCI1635215.1 hypothetical protein [Bifidobacterium sp.]
MNVNGYKVARQDIRLIRGDSHRLGAICQTYDAAGKLIPVNLTGWSGFVELRSMSGVLWWSGQCDMTNDGYAVTDMSSDTLTAAVWHGRSTGQWKCVVTSPANVVSTLAWGYWYLTD